MLTRRLGLLVAAIVISLAWAASQAAAQPPEGQQGRGGRRGFMPMAPAGGARILLLETVQKDLQLSADQVAKLKDVVKTSDEAAKDARAGMRDLSREERQAKRKEIRGKMETVAKDARKKVEAILTTAQIERLKQIRLQLAGAAVFANPDAAKAAGIPNVAKTLDITQEQREKIHGLVEKLRGERGNFRSLSQEERRTKMAEFREKMRKAVLEVLTPEQKTKLEKLEGEKIELKPSEVLAPEEPGFDLPARGPGR